MCSKYWNYGNGNFGATLVGQVLEKKRMVIVINIEGKCTFFYLFASALVTFNKQLHDHAVPSKRTKLADYIYYIYLVNELSHDLSQKQEKLQISRSYSLNFLVLFNFSYLKFTSEVEILNRKLHGMIKT